MFSFPHCKTFHLCVAIVTIILPLFSCGWCIFCIIIFTVFAFTVVYLISLSALSPKHLYYGVLGNAAWAGVSGYHLFRGGKANKQGVASKMDFFLKMDVGFALCFAVPDLLIPDVILNLSGVSQCDVYTCIIHDVHMFFSVFVLFFTTVMYAAKDG